MNRCVGWPGLSDRLFPISGSSDEVRLPSGWDSISLEGEVRPCGAQGLTGRRILGAGLEPCLSG